MVASVLLVDDDADICEIISRALRGAGYKVYVTDNGARALAVLDEILPSVVLVDLLMPVMGGWQLLEIMRSRPRLKSMPTIVITASAELPRVSCRVLRKPFDLADLIRTVGEACAA
jgi:CheY-like chemotaxis protein